MTADGRSVTVWCPSCGEEFTEGVARCPDCGVEVVSAEAVPGSHEPHHTVIPEGYALLAGNWEGSPEEFIEWLDDEDIPVIPVHDEDNAPTKLYVPRSQLEEAEALLDEFHEEDEFEEVDVPFEEEDLSPRSRQLLQDGDLDTFSMLADGDEQEVLGLADRLEEAGIPVLVVDVEEGLCEVHVPERAQEQAEGLLPEQEEA